MNDQQLEDLIGCIYGLGSKIESLHNRKTEQEQKSFQCNELYAALAKAQGEMETAGLTNANPFFKSKYADLAELVRASRPALTRHGLAVTQYIDNAVLYTMLCHSSGQHIQSSMSINPTKTDVQSLGSYITYLRRYMYAALVGVVVSNEDDDGESSIGREIKKVVPVISKSQAAALEYAMGDEKIVLLEKICTNLGIKNILDTPIDRYPGILTWVNKHKKDE